MSLLEQIHEAESSESLKSFRERVGRMTPRERQEFIQYCKMTGAGELAEDFFSLESLDIISGTKPLFIEQRRQIFVPHTRDDRGLIMDDLSEHEIEFLLQAFFKNVQERKYITELVFYKNNFLSKTSADTLEYLEKVENLFKKISNNKKTVLRIVGEEKIYPEVQERSANDDYFIPYSERNEDMEAGYLDCIHEAFQVRLEYLESLFCQIVRALAEESHNHIWAMDPESAHFYIPEYMQSKIELIRSICEVHAHLDPGFPMLHTLVESTVASWILIYKGFSAPVEKVRGILGQGNH